MPNSTTMAPLTATLPSLINSSPLLREQIPAAERNFCNRINGIDIGCGLQASSYGLRVTGYRLNPYNFRILDLPFDSFDFEALDRLAQGGELVEPFRISDCGFPACSG